MAACVFDLDGTILDTLEDLYLSSVRALEKNGLPPRRREEIRAFVGNGIANLISRCVPEGTPAELEHAVFEDFVADYAIHCNDHTRPYDGVTGMLKTLAEKGVKLSVVSNKGDFAVQDLVKLHFPGMFDVVLGQQDGIARKPAPDMVYRALELMDETVEDAVYLGDSEVDVTTSDNASIRLILVTWGFRSPEQLREAGGTNLVDTVLELQERILEYLNK
jgi:phosphoglycolate phosphatase